jgi:hypothetical protein
MAALVAVGLLCLVWGFGGFALGYDKGATDALRSAAREDRSTLKLIEVEKLRIKQKQELEQLEKGEVR